jgi:hypothetical protein
MIDLIANTKPEAGHRDPSEPSPCARLCQRIGRRALSFSGPCNAAERRAPLASELATITLTSLGNGCGNTRPALVTPPPDIDHDAPWA